MRGVGGDLLHAAGEIRRARGENRAPVHRFRIARIRHGAKRLAQGREALNQREHVVRPAHAVEPHRVHKFAIVRRAQQFPHGFARAGVAGGIRREGRDHIGMRRALLHQPSQRERGGVRKGFKQKMLRAQVEKALGERFAARLRADVGEHERAARRRAAGDFPGRRGDFQRVFAKGIGFERGCARFDIGAVHGFHRAGILATAKLRARFAKAFAQIRAHRAIEKQPLHAAPICLRVRFPRSSPGARCIFHCSARPNNCGKCS